MLAGRISSCIWRKIVAFYCGGIRCVIGTCGKPRHGPKTKKPTPDPALRARAGTWPPSIWPHFKRGESVGVSAAKSTWHVVEQLRLLRYGIGAGAAFGLRPVGSSRGHWSPAGSPQALRPPRRRCPLRPRFQWPLRFRRRCSRLGHRWPLRRCRHLGSSRNYRPACHCYTASRPDRKHRDTGRSSCGRDNRSSSAVRRDIALRHRVARRNRVGVGSVRRPDVVAVIYPTVLRRVIPPLVVVIPETPGIRIGGPRFGTNRGVRIHRGALGRRALVRALRCVGRRPVRPAALAAPATARRAGPTMPGSTACPKAAWPNIIAPSAMIQVVFRMVFSFQCELLSRK